MQGWLNGSLVVLLSLVPASVQASYAFYVGGQLTDSGAVLIGGTGEEVSSHWLALEPRRDHAPGERVRVGITAEASIPGERFEIPQAPTTYRYLSMFYSDFEGFPPPLSNGGINEYQVAVRDVWAPARRELVDMTPTPQHGLSYSDLALRVLERARTAREGVELIGRLIAEHGYATYGGNTHLIADPREGWVVWELPGGQGLWAAERLGADAVRVLYPGSIGEFPIDFGQSPDHMASANLVRFAEAQGWYDRASGQPFDLWKVYGVQGKRARGGDFKRIGPAELEAEIRRALPSNEVDMMERVRDRRIADDEAGYGFVAALREGVKAPLVRAWVAPTGAVTAPFLPWWIGVRSVPLSYRQHRYLTRDAGSHFLHPDYQDQEATPFAGRLFKRLLYYACEGGDGTSLAQVQTLLRAFERQSRQQIRWVERAARKLIGGGERPLGHDLLTHYSHTRAREALHLGETLARMLHTARSLEGDLRAPAGDAIHQSPGGATVHCLPEGDPDRPLPPGARYEETP